MKKLILASLVFFASLSPAFAENTRVAHGPDTAKELRSALSDMSRQALVKNPSLHVADGDKSGDQVVHRVTDEIVEHLHRGLAAEEMTDAELSDYVADVSSLSSALWLGTEYQGIEGLLKLGPSEDPPACTRQCRMELFNCFAVLAPENPGLSPLCVVAWEICLLDCVSPF